MVSKKNRLNVLKAVKAHPEENARAHVLESEEVDQGEGEGHPQIIDPEEDKGQVSDHVAGPMTKAEEGLAIDQGGNTTINAKEGRETAEIEGPMTAAEVEVIQKANEKIDGEAPANLLVVSEMRHTA